MKKKLRKSNVKFHPVTSKSPDYKLALQPVLRFSPTAWAKLLFFRDRGDTEISGFGITEPDDLLYVTEFVTIKQDATVVSISLDDIAIADYFESQVDLGRKPEQFFRVWAHTHPGDSSIPSSTDEATFRRVFGKTDWAIMLVIAEEGRVYARLSFHVVPGGQILIPVEVDYSQPFPASDQESWEAEYQANIKVESWSHKVVYEEETGLANTEYEISEYDLPPDILEQLEAMEPAERKAVLDELVVRPELWSEEEVVQW